MIDQSDFDKLVTEHYAADREETDAPPPMTPANAIACAICELRERRAWWQRRADEDGVLPWLTERIACLEQAQRELEVYAKVKAALKVLRDVI
jgi:hypothetical protein